MIKNVGLLVGIVFGIFVSFGVVQAQSVSQSYQIAEQTRLGMIVSIQDESAGLIELAGLNNQDSLIGVVIDETESLLSTTGESTEVQVASAGQAFVLVSDEFGRVAAGDVLMPSTIRGVAAASNANAQFAVGVALETFSEGVFVNRVQVDGAEYELRRVRAEVDIRAQGTSDGQTVLESFGSQLVGRPVSLVQVVLGLTVLTASIVVAGLMSYGAIRSGMISIGRNPLSTKAIYRQMARVLLYAGLVLALGGGMAYIALIL